MPLSPDTSGSNVCSGLREVFSKLDVRRACSDTGWGGRRTEIRDVWASPASRQVLECILRSILTTPECSIFWDDLRNGRSWEEMRACQVPLNIAC
jgi:hypothetical protein